MMTDEGKLPGYLQDAPQTGHLYGTLSYNRRSKCWTIKGEPCVTEMAARLFPGSERRRGEARFTANRRIIGDVNWLMMRYPLEIAPRDRELWKNALAQAREHVLLRMNAEKLPRRSTPPEGTFEGELREFQKEGLSFLLANPRTLLADEMGLGKTVQALACLAATIPCADCCAAASSAELADGNHALSALGGKTGTCLRVDRLEALSAAGSGRLYHSLSAAARLEAGFAADGVQGGRF